MDQKSRSEFVTGYTKVLTRAWTSDEYASHLEQHPNAAIAECGLRVPEGALVSLVRVIPSGEHEPTLNRQIELWERGERTGSYELHVPKTPQVDTTQLSEGDLMAGRHFDDCCCGSASTCGDG
jgi:hypothetical protein